MPRTRRSGRKHQLRKLVRELYLPATATHLPLGIEPAYTQEQVFIYLPWRLIPSSWTRCHRYVHRQRATVLSHNRAHASVGLKGCWCTRKPGKYELNDPGRDSHNMGTINPNANMKFIEPKIIPLDYHFHTLSFCSHTWILILRQQVSLLQLPLLKGRK